MNPQSPENRNDHRLLNFVHRVAAVAAATLFAISAHAYQGMPVPKLHVSGRFLQDPTGKNVLLHGYMQPAASWFNGEGRNFNNPTDFTRAANVAPALAFYKNVATIFATTNPQYGQDHGWSATFVRFIGDHTSVQNFAPGWNASGNLANATQFHGWIANVLVPYVDYCRSVGLYVVICGNPSVAYPGGDVNKNITQQYRNNLVAFWQAVAGAPGIKSADNVMFEICNEPILIETAFGANNWGGGSATYWAALTAFMQPILDAIRATGADNVVWVPGMGWQGECQGFANFPVTGTNVGYSGHVYPAYGSVYDNAAKVRALWNSNYAPAANLAPMLLTELWWNPNDGTGYQNLWNANTSGFGNAMKSAMDDQGNVSYLVGMVGDLLGNINSGLAATTLSSGQGAQASFAWWPNYHWMAPQPDVGDGATARLVNISSRAYGGTGSKVAIGGFVVSGNAPKRLLLRAVGPTLTNQGLSRAEAMSDPTIEVHAALQNNSVLVTNDDWAAGVSAGDIPVVAAQVGAATFANDDAKSAAALLTVNPGVYSFLAADKSDLSGIVLIEVYDADATPTAAKLANISTRAYCGAGNNVTIGGFVVTGDATKHVLLRAVGPTLAAQGLGVAEVLQDPTIEVHDAQHGNAVIAANDNWGDNPNRAEILSTGARVGATPLHESDTASSALLISLRPGVYSFTARGKNAAAGVVLVEVYDVD